MNLIIEQDCPTFIKNQSTLEHVINSLKQHLELSITHHDHFCEVRVLQQTTKGITELQFCEIVKVLEKNFVIGVSFSRIRDNAVCFSVYRL